MNSTSVVIVGAGPTGLMAANQLVRFGIDFVILDSKEGPTLQSRAILVSARSLEMYQQMGLSDTVLEKGARINSFNIYSRGKKKAEVKIGEIGKGLTDFHYLLGYEQSKNEELLYQTLKKNGAEVTWNTEFISLKQTTSGVIAVVKSAEETYEISGRYLLACDGARSPIRHALNFKFRGGTYEKKFYVADVEMTWPLEYDRLVISPGDFNLCAFFPLQGHHRYRVLGTLPKEFSDKDDITFADLVDVIKKSSEFPVTFEQVNWFSVYKLHHRCVDRFRSGDVFLAGDAAHINSPAGGQGMNTGLQDAYNITWKLAFVLKGWANPEILRTYNEERLPFAKFLMTYTDRLFNFMTSSNWFIRTWRRYVALDFVGIALSRRSLRPRIFNTVSQLWYSYHRKGLTVKSMSGQRLKFRSGDRLPYLGEGSYHKFTEPCFHLIHITTGESALVSPDKFPFPVKVVAQQLERWSSVGVKSELFVLVRPDNYVMMVADRLDEIHASIKISPFFSA